MIDTSITIMKANAVDAGKVDWVALKQNAYKQAADLNSPYELGATMREMYSSIGDFHGSFFYRDSTFRWNGKKLVISDSVRQEWNKRSGIKTAILDGNFGYVRVPSMPGSSRADFDRKAQELNDSLCTILNHYIQGIVIDLRLDGGGAMFPMILGLKQVLGEGKIGAFQTSRAQQWLIKNNTFMMDTAILAAITPKCSVNAQSIPCVLLVGQGTGSSGEFLVMSFMGREKTFLIGNETGGYVTVNKGFDINNTSAMNLSVGYGLDRKGRIYKQAIKPDIVLDKTDNFNNLKNDAKIQAAVKWLNTQK